RRGTAPRRAGVSSFGVGGTNAHVVLEEAPAAPRSESTRGAYLLPLSARSASALDNATARLCEHLKMHPEIDLDSVAYTLQVGRRHLEHRRAVACTHVEDAIRALEQTDSRRVHAGVRSDHDASVAFMFPGQGSQYRNMGAGLYRDDPHFRRDVDRCAEILEPHLHLDLRAVLCGGAHAADVAAYDLQSTSLAQP